MCNFEGVKVVFVGLNFVGNGFEDRDGFVMFEGISVYCDESWGGCVLGEVVL